MWYDRGGRQSGAVPVSFSASPLSAPAAQRHWFIRRNVTMTWIALGVLLALLLLLNWCGLIVAVIHSYRHPEQTGGFSFAPPLIGGVLGCVGCLVCPIEGVSRFAWLPLVLDPSILVTTVFVIIQGGIGGEADKGTGADAGTGSAPAAAPGRAAPPSPGGEGRSPLKAARHQPATPFRPAPPSSGRGDGARPARSPRPPRQGGQAVPAPPRGGGRPRGGRTTGGGSPLRLKGGASRQGGGGGRPRRPKRWTGGRMSDRRA